MNTAAAPAPVAPVPGVLARDVVMSERRAASSRPAAPFRVPAGTPVWIGPVDAAGFHRVRVRGGLASQRVSASSVRLS